MAIIFGSDAGVNEDAFESFTNALINEFKDVATNVVDSINSITGESLVTPPPPTKETVFVDTGFSNVPGTSFVGSTVSNVDDVQTRRITSQEPQTTVYIKKRAFSSLRSDYDTRFMDTGEKLLLRATKILFERKCIQIGAYEALTKLSTLASEDATLDALAIDQIADLIEEFAKDATNLASSEIVQTFANGDVELGNELTAKFQVLVNELANQLEAIEELRALSAQVKKLRSATQTTWVIDPDDADVVNIGRGSGVIELTLINDINTSLDLEGGGNFSFTMQDPYNFTKISNEDLEIALSSAFQEHNDILADLNKSSGAADSIAAASRGATTILDEAREKEQELTNLRKNRIANTFGLGENTAPLSSSDALEIVFEINATSLGDDKVIGSVSAIPETFNKDTFRIILAQLPIDEQLTLEEDTKVVEIFDLLEEYVDAIARLNNTIIQTNENNDVKYARRKLRLYYLGKSIIQPMDSIHVFMRGNTKRPDELIGPLSALLNDTNFVNLFSDDEEALDDVLKEEMRQFGITSKEIDVDLYRSLRTSSLMRNAGIHVFGGLVSRVSENYSASSGTYTTSVSGESNLKWLSMSRVNTKPSLDQTQGLLEDPLTPFALNIDPDTGLISGEPELLDDIKNRQDKLSYNQGVRTAEKVSSDTIEQDFEEDTDGTLSSIKSCIHTAGLTYRWKEGIIVATRNVNLKTALDGSPNQSDKLRRDMGLSVVENPFANLDAADVVSILVTGREHNYASFLKNARDAGTYSPTDTNHQSFFNSFFDIAQSTNRSLGNFEPFKTIEVDEAEVRKRLELQADLQVQSSEISKLRAELARLQDQQNSITPVDGIESLGDVIEDNRRKAAISGITSALESVKDELEIKLDELSEQIIQESEGGTIGVIGNDLAGDLGLETGTLASEHEAVTERRKNLRLSNKLLQLRTQFACKFNQDKNLFIVADEYDKDLDIQAFVLSMLGSQSPDLWRSEFKTPLEICKNVAKTLDFEFFCDSQGHIRFRPPTYNRVPLSLILKLFLLKEQGEELFPPFISLLFDNRKEALKKELEAIDAELEVQSVLLGLDLKEEGNKTVGAILSESIQDVNNVEVLTGQFAPNLDSVESDATTLIKKENALFDITGGNSIKLDNINLEKAKKRLTSLNDPNAPNVNSNRLREVNKIGQLASSRQRVESSLSSIEAQETNIQIKDPNKASEEVKNNLFTVFGSLIEDDLNDFLGFGAGERFIIYDEQIINYNFTEADDNVFCRVDVQGEQDLIGDQAGELGGVPVIWAGATNFDLWRQYGWREGGSHSKPFFKDGDSQCAPYALFLLTRAQRDTVRGTITVYGNEFYQIGDVVYINSRDMLYYVTSVKHNFSYSGGTFETTLDLRYGHPLGEYIATPLDVIGKNLIANQRQFNNVKSIRETANEFRGINIGTIKFPEEGSKDTKKDMLGGPFFLHNIRSLKNALLRSHHELEGGTFTNIEIRGYITFDDEKNSNADKVRRRMTEVRNWLLNPVGVNIIGTDEYVTIQEHFTEKIPQSVNPIDDKIDPVDLSKVLEGVNFERTRYPSEEAFDASVEGKVDNIIEIVLYKEEDTEVLGDFPTGTTAGIA